MSFWAAARTAWQLGGEYADAWTAAREAAERGEPVSRIVEAFASRTENKLDDEAVAALTAGVVWAIGKLQELSLWLAQVAEAIEDHGPTYLAKLKALTATLRTEGPKLLDALDQLAERAAGQAERVRVYASVAGVLCVRAVMRLEKLRA